MAHRIAIGVLSTTSWPRIRVAVVIGVLIGGRDIALYRVDGEVFATDNLCSHGQARLCDGFLLGHEIEFPFHDPAGYMNPNRVGALIDSADVDTAVALGPDLPANAPAVLPAGDSGGGGLGGGWLLALALAVGLLTRARPSGRR